MLSSDLSDKVHVFCSSLGMRKMFSKGVWGHAGPNFVLVSDPSRMAGVVRHCQKMRVSQSLSWFMLAGEQPQMQHQALPSEMERSKPAGKSEAML